MYLFKINGATIALVENPNWVRVQKNGYCGLCEYPQATGVAINGTVYNLPPHDIGGVATVDYEEVQSGTYLLKQEANIDYLSMMTGIDLPNEEPEQPVFDEMEGDSDE